jgi:thymidylate kinase
MSSKNKYIVCITGPDGSGKSTLINGLLHAFPNAVECSIWDALTYSNVKLFASKREVDAYLCQLTPTSRVQFLSHALTWAMENALNTEADIVFVNAYYYKYFANEVALGADESFVNTLIKTYPTADLNVFLNLSVEECASRKQGFSSYECGCAVPNRNNFMSFQRRCRNVLNQWVQKDWLQIDAINKPEDLVAQVKNLITQQL